MAMLTIAYVRKIAPSAGDEKSVKTPERRQAVIRIWKYIFFTGFSFRGIFRCELGSFLFRYHELWDQYADQRRRYFDPYKPINLRRAFGG